MSRSVRQSCETGHQATHRRRTTIRAGRYIFDPDAPQTRDAESRRGRRAGLWDPQFEVDACGVGFIANQHGEKSHEIVANGLEILCNLTHRGAAGADESTGDGAGILMQMPHEFLVAAAKEQGMELPAEGEYGVAVLFLSKDQGAREEIERVVDEQLKARGHQVLGWRTVPTNRDALGRIAADKEPAIRQVFIGKASHIGDRDAFERDLYVSRKQIETAALKRGFLIPEELYVVSMSANTLIYKGLLLAEQTARYFPDLTDKRMVSALALVHQRFSTNTFPEWDLAQPFRYMAHNGEINTLQGNVNWMRAREAMLESPLFGNDIQALKPVARAGASDSACFDNVLELLNQGGRDLPHAVMMMIPEAWERDHRMSEELRGFYEYHGCLMEPWDGPASIAFTDGKVIGATLDRNGLRPSRYIVTKDGLVVMASEVGVLDIPMSQITESGRLQPGRIFLVDLAGKRLVTDHELKSKAAARQPYSQWIEEQKITLEELPEPEDEIEPNHETVFERQRIFGYTVEDLDMVMGPMAAAGKEPIGSMGNDSALAVLSERPKPLYNYFKQHFAQVSNPPIDPIREELVMSLVSMVGAEGNLFEETPEQAHLLELPQPVLTNRDLAKLREVKIGNFESTTLSMLWQPDGGVDGLEPALADLCKRAEAAVRDGKTVLILSDRGADENNAPIPALLATAAVHHHLIRAGLRKRCGLVIESGEPREVQHFALLLGYGAHAINPYLAFETLHDMINEGKLADVDKATAERHFIKAVGKGLLKVFSKMGISTLQSYHGAQIFEAVGLNQSLIDRYFVNTPSRINGADLSVIAEEAIRRHRAAYPQRVTVDPHLDWGGDYHWRAEGEDHQWSPMAIANLQKAAKLEDADAYRAFAQEVAEADRKALTIRGLLDFDFADRTPVPIDEVEPVDAIVRRFKTGAMSFGSISREAHESLAIGMNRLGGRSNTGEGGEDEGRFSADPNGDLRRSSIKQVASGRFGVTANYLANSDEIQIKMAQGAKPGEGGQLPGHKVSVEIATVRNSTPGVGLISPPPHHDIYSIEDLAQLIFDLKNANPAARINVKLVSEVGVGTIAAGVAKAHADVVLISGDSGGTGASPWSSIKHAGVPWEIGLAETHQVLVDNGLRSRIVVETDGGLKSGRDVVIAALLGAEEFGFGLASLVTLGCILLRKCHLNTCSVGIATQRQELREKFKGDPQHLVNYFRFVAGEVREYMAKLGFRTVDEMVGQVDALKVREAIDQWKAHGLDLTPLLEKAPAKKASDMYCNKPQNHGLDKILDRELIHAAKPALEDEQPVQREFRIRNLNRTCGTMLSYEVTKRFGSKGLPPETIHYTFRGMAGQSFGAFVTRGIRFDLIGAANDYFGKGLSGGELSVHPPDDAAFVPEDNYIIGNVSFYGATSGKAFVRGRAGERFCVRNSGVETVVEGVGDHGCEYMTGGRVVVLGDVGRNFAAGMSGGIAYVLMDRAEFEPLCNMEMVELEHLEQPDEIAHVEGLIKEHVARTGSTVGQRVLENWAHNVETFVKVMPTDYKRALRSGVAERE